MEEPTQVPIESLSSLQRLVREFIGTPPDGFAYLEYGVALVVLLHLLNFVFTFFNNISKTFWR